MKPQEGKGAKFTVYMEDSLRRALRIRAIEEGTSATSLVVRLIQDYLKKPTAHKGGDR